VNEKSYNVLFICTGNSARSILAEAVMNHLGRGRFRAYSAGSTPTGVVNPLAIETLKRLRLPTEGYRSKAWEEFAVEGAPRMDFVFTVCDRAAGEVCPIWPGQPMTAHWGMPDPAAVVGTLEEKRKVFLNAASLLRRRIELMLALPLASLDRLALQQAVRDIGKQ
jgi:protein-tyrosine-phosphatase